jgi:hypothetical protein
VGDDSTGAKGVIASCIAFAIAIVTASAATSGSIHHAAVSKTSRPSLCRIGLHLVR